MKENRKDRHMKEIILSSDGLCRIYSVPDEVADDLDRYCTDFDEWIWENPNGDKLLQEFDDGYGACYDETDFIDYLNEWIFPEKPSVLIKETDFYCDEIPEEYRSLPRFNF